MALPRSTVRSRVSFPGDPPFAIVPVLAVLVMFVTLLVVGPRLPRWALALLGPIGVVLIAYALATSPGPGDAAILYALPVLWTTIFFGRRGAVAIVACIAVGEAVALLLLPAGSAYPGRWVDVMVCTCAIAVVARALDRRSELLLERFSGEARTDPLTGLLNRRGFDEHARRELAHARRDGRPIALAAFDIDHFKRINDEQRTRGRGPRPGAPGWVASQRVAGNRRRGPSRGRGVCRAHAGLRSGRRPRVCRPCSPCPRCD